MLVDLVVESTFLVGPWAVCMCGVYPPFYAEYTTAVQSVEMQTVLHVHRLLRVLLTVVVRVLAAYQYVVTAQRKQSPLSVSTAADTPHTRAFTTHSISFLRPRQNTPLVGALSRVFDVDLEGQGFGEAHELPIVRFYSCAA